MISRLLLLSAAVLAVSAQRWNRDTGYNAPEASYGAPEPSYGAPEPSYHEPEPAYGAPESAEYSSPAYSAPGDSFDLSSLVVPALVIAALLLLFPNYINLTTVRRSFKENNGPMGLLNKVKDIAQAVLEDDTILTKYDN